MQRNILNRIPKTDLILKEEIFRELLSVHSESFVKAGLKVALEEIRSELVRYRKESIENKEEQSASDVKLEEGQGDRAIALSLSTDHIYRLTLKAMERMKKSGLVRVVNATGIVLHTNLGRSLLSEDAAEAVKTAATGFVTLEYDLESGARGSREKVLLKSLRVLTGAEDAVVVNNNAAAVLIVLAALSKGKEAIVSRGELVEIGGSFRIPDVMEMSGAILLETGTTNRTRISDYSSRISERTGLLLKVHTSNYRILGFHEETGIDEMATLSKGTGIPLYVDLGSGALMDTSSFTTEHEMTVAETIGLGADIVSFSGDKLLGGPQAGIIVGRTALVDRIRRHPLMRALRPDKMTIAALESTLHSWRFDQGRGIPARDMLMKDVERIRTECEALSIQLQDLGFKVEVKETVSMAGGGTLPLAEVRSCGVFVGPNGKNGFTLEDLKEKLRQGEVPVIARIEHDELVLDLRTVQEGEHALIVDRFRQIAEGKGEGIE
jgi:L-seryl-tRNA(Ser) seleniumtransferase